MYIKHTEIVTTGIDEKRVVTTGIDEMKKKQRTLRITQADELLGHCDENATRDTAK